MEKIVKWRNIETGLEAQLNPALLGENPEAEIIDGYRCISVNNENIDEIAKSILNVIPFNYQFKLIIKQDEYIDIEKFLKKTDIVELPTDAILQMIVSINQFLSDEIHFIDKNKNGSIASDFEKLGTDALDIEEMLKYYEEVYTKPDNSKIRYDLEEINFVFSNRTFKVKNLFFKNLIIDSLKDNFENHFDDFSFKERLTYDKQKISSELFDKLSATLLKKHFRYKKQIFEFVADLFTCAGLKDVNRELLKTWYDRFEKKKNTGF